ncbi:MAG: response regulator [Lachnospiraceae bacterium]|nr:response regulator [Lachnospiraceae bacterium]
MIPVFAYLIPTILSLILFWILLISTEEQQKNTYFILLFLTVFMVNLAYFCVSISQTAGEALLAYKCTYFGGTFLTFYMLRCILQICNVKLKHRVFLPLMAINAEVLVVVFMAGYNTLHYRSYSIIRDNGLTTFVKTYGPHHSVYLVVLAINTLLPFIAIGWAFFNRKRVSWIYAFLLGLAELLTLGVYILERAIYLKIELLPYTYIVIEIIILIIINRISLYDVSTNVQLSLAHTDDHGYVLVDTGMRYIGCDDVARMYFPELNKLELDRKIEDTFLKEEFGDWVEESLLHPVPPKIMERCGDIVKITTHPFYTRNGKKHAGFIIQILNDTETQNYITELEKSKELAEEMARKAELASKSKSKFLANISHEIRTPINAVLGFNELVIREASEDKIRNYAIDIRKSGDTMLNLINDLLDISRIESGKMELIPVSFDLVSLLNDVITMTSVRAQDKGLFFELDIDPETPRYLYGDEIRIKQIFTNILTNAVKYTSKGTVTLKISHEILSSGKVLLHTSVVDTGIGMKEETIQNIFIPYERLEEQRNRYIEGTGLGLSITLTLLTMMGSRLEINSEYGKGSDFSFDLKLDLSGEGTVGNLDKSFEELHDSIKEYNVTFTAPDAHVLVVDDTKVNIRIFKGLLKRTLVQIDDAASGEEALELTARRKYDAIFIDHMMPGMDGIETFNAIKSSPDNLNRHTPMVMMTANVTTFSKETYLSMGFDDYIGKPVNPILLEAMLHRLL